MTVVDTCSVVSAINEKYEATNCIFEQLVRCLVSFVGEMVLVLKTFLLSFV